MTVRDIPATMVPLKDYTLQPGEVGLVYEPVSKEVKTLVVADNRIPLATRIGTHGDNIMLVGTRAEINGIITGLDLVIPDHLARELTNLGE